MCGIFSYRELYLIQLDYSQDIYRFNEFYSYCFKIEVQELKSSHNWLGKRILLEMYN